PGGGLVGLGRQGSYWGTVTYDDFRVDVQELGSLSEPFDNAPVGGLPSGWSQWSNQGGTPFQVSPTAAQSGAAGLLSTAPSSSSGARAWPETLQLADAQVSAALLLNSLAPARLLLRGQNLNTTSPSYYALQATRGLSLELVRVVQGTATSLATVPSGSYFSGQWVRLA